MSTHAEIYAFIVAHLRDAPLPREGLDTFDLFAGGAIDSLGAMRFASALEERFDIELTDEDILSDDFRTLGGVVPLVLRAIERRQSSAA